MKPVEALHSSAWHARLELEFSTNGAGTRLSRRRHSGPLLVQRPFYAEGHDVCQVVIVHPPGGIAGGDVLDIDIGVQANAVAQLTTPGAGKWYCGFGRQSRQIVSIKVADSAICEWMPQENIVFDGAQAAMSLDVQMSTGAIFCGWDFTCLGRPASNEQFIHGALRQRVSIRQNDKPQFLEQAVIEASDESRYLPTVLGSHCAYGTMIVSGAARDERLLSVAREITANETNAGVTWMNDNLVARWVGHSTEEGRALFTRLWSALRPWYAGRKAVPPRIWST